MGKSVTEIWETIQIPVLSWLKVFLLRKFPADILHFYNYKIEALVRFYSRHLPSYVADNEIDDLKTVAQLEFLESLKAWDPVKYPDVWPLAYSRLLGAMKDHIRYITRSNPSLYYEWISDAAYLYLSVNQRADFETKVETGIELNQAMESLQLREKRVIIWHTRDDMTFAEIGLKLGVSESQISRIYKGAIEKIRRQIKKMDRNLNAP